MRRWLTAGSVLIALGLVLGLTLKSLDSVVTGELALDLRLSRMRSELPTALARTIHIGLGPVLGPVFVAVAAWVIARRDRRFAAALVVFTALGWSAVEIAKSIVARPRPPADLVGALEIESVFRSYPSGHTGFAMAIVAAVVAACRLTGRATGRVLAIGIPAVLLVGWSRLYLGVHYLGDVIGAVIVVCGAVCLAYAVLTPRLLNLPTTGSRQ